MAFILSHWQSQATLTSHWPRHARQRWPQWADAATAGGATQQLIDAMASYDQALPAAALPIINAAVAGTISVGSLSLAVPAALYSRRAFG